LRALIKASSSTIAPLAMLITKALGLKALIAASSNNLVVSGVSGVAITT